MSPILPSRRQLLTQSGCGFGALALNAILPRSVSGMESPSTKGSAESVAERATMFSARAKRIIFVFMQGGPSHVDSFDYKPELIARDGQTIDFTGVRFGDFGQGTKQKLMKDRKSVV